jgi:hydrogenase nickel incorporation protein HypA/HybF
MHEFSLAQDVVEIAAREAEKHKVTRILELEIEVGVLSGVEPDTFQTALEMISEGTLISDTLIKIIRKPGKGICQTCHKEFEMKDRLTLCPGCDNFPSEISGGLEFRVISILAE